MTIAEAERLRPGDVIHNDALSPYYGERLVVSQRGVVHAYDIAYIRVMSGRGYETESFVNLTTLVRRYYPDHIALPEGI